MHLSEAPVAIIWDGFRRVAAIWNEGGGKPARFLAAEMSGSVELIAATDAGHYGPNALIGALPPGCRIVHLVTLTDAGMLDSIPVQLDDRLTTDRVDAGLEGLVKLHLHARKREGDARPDLSAEQASTASLPSDAAVAVGLNRVSIGSDGSRRILAGPFLHPDEIRSASTFVTGEMGAEGDGLVLDFASDDPTASDGAGGVLVAHLSEAMRRARQDLAAIDADLRLAVEAELDGLLVAPGLSQLDSSGISHIAAFRRGFCLFGAKAGEARIAIPEWRDGDEVLLLAHPGRRLIWTGDEGAVSGTPIAVRAENGRLKANSLRDAYAPSASTGLTTGVRAGALISSGAGSPAAVPDDSVLVASRLAIRLLETAVPATEATMLGEAMASWSDAVAMEPGSGPLAMLDASMRRGYRIGGLIAGLAEAATIDPLRLEELAERNLEDQIALLLWAISAPLLAARACKARLLLPLPGKGLKQELETLLNWYDDPALPQRLSRGAMALAGQDRKAARLLHDMAACVHQSWIDNGVAAETGAGLDAVRDRIAARPDSKLEGLLADLRRSALRQTPQAPALEVLGRMRSELQGAARQAGGPDELVEELGARLAELNPAEIPLLHEHFARLRRQAARAAAAVVLLDRWEAEAGCAGLAKTVDRSGDALAGAARLAAGAARLAETLGGIETLSSALAGLDAAVDVVLGAEDRASPAATALQAALGGYGRLLLLHRAMAQADEVFAAVPFAHAALSDRTDPGFGAALRRLRAGTGETLERYLMAAALVSGSDHDWAAAAAATARPAASA